jgi:YD repeat-containing protein
MSNTAISGVRSDAYNFLSFISSGVDPRTGTYSCSLSLSSLLSNALSGPSVPLVLGFNALQNFNQGFGIGWNMQFSSYNRTTRRLSLSSGATHHAVVSNRDFVITDKKVKDLKTSRDEASLFIEHKSGVLEVLSNPGGQWDEWLVSRIHSPEGRVINLSYSVHRGRRYLKEVRDETHRLLTINVNGDSISPEITLWPDSPDNTMTFRLRLQNNELSRVILSVGNKALASWRLRYETVDGLRLISRLEQPTGGIEQVTYRPSALRMPSGAPVSALPAVLSHTTFPRSDQPAITREYQYSTNNYLGYGANAKWRNDGDNLYQATGNYEYHSTEDLVLGSGSSKRTIRRTKRVYNRFHLQVEETVNQNGKTVRSRTRYHEKPGLRFENQPGNFQLPARVDVDYFDATAPNTVRRETTLTDYDDFGNVLKKVSPTGITEVFEYYPPGGADGCPADAFGAVRWLKQKTLIPAADRAPAPGLVTRYRYIDLPSASARRSRFIALAQESVWQEGQPAPVLTIARQYETNPRSAFFGRVRFRTETVEGVPTVLEYRYELLGGALCTHTTVKAKDGTRSTRSISQNVLTGIEVKTVEQLGVTIETAHDRLGRKISEILAPKTSNQVSKSYRYQLADKLADPVQTTSVAPNGAVMLTRLDGLDRKASVQVQDVDAGGKPMRAIYSAKYDALGQLVEELNTDWLDGKAHQLLTRHRYDDWGNRCATIGPDGVLNHDRHDPVRLTQTQGLDKAGSTVTTKNVFGKNDSVQRFDRNGKPGGTTRYLYDGLGRCIQQTDPHGRSTRFAYDFADRLVMTQLPDGTRIRKAFVAHSTEDLATDIWVNDYLAGHRTFDGLLRVSSITVGGRTERFTYEGAQPNPATHVTASGKVIAYKYDPTLNNQVTERTVSGNSNLNARFRYDSTHAKLLQASCPANQQRRDYFPSGQLKGDQFNEGPTRLNTLQRNSLNGLPLEYVNAAGLKQVTRYDPLCRIAQVEQGSVTASYTYDAQGRVSKIETADRQSKRTLVTQLEYDDFGREVRRVLTVDARQPEALAQVFNESDKLIRRVLTRGTTVLRDEIFAYDLRGRLEHYRCNGAHPPRDSAGKAIVSQSYVFDELDNIRQLRTVFAGGENISTYEYGYLDKTQLSRVRHSHPDYAAQQAVFTYDADGNQLNDERGRRMIYDELGRLASVAQEQP